MLASSKSCFFGLAAINFCRAAPEMLRLFLRGEFAGRLASFGGQTAAGGFIRVRPLQAKHFLELAFDLLLSFPTDGTLGRVKPRFGK